MIDFGWINRQDFRRLRTWVVLIGGATFALSCILWGAVIWSLLCLLSRI